jgi:hypothetical protein
MSEVVHLPTAAQHPVLVVDHQSRAVQMLGEWASAAEAAFGVASRLTDTSFVPEQFRGKPLEATAAILAGLEVGLQPMAALKSFDIIYGVAAPRALALRAIVQSFGHEVVMVESTESRCKMKGRRRDSSEWQTVSWTMDRAKQLGLTGKENWRKQPATMLVARATSELCRLVAADAILGLGYSAEEISDGEVAVAASPSAVEATATPATAPRKLSRRPLPDPAPASDEPPEAPEPRTTVEDPDDPWGELVPLLTSMPGQSSTVPQLETGIRHLFRLMELVGLWETTDAGDSLHRALKKKLQVEHLSGLKKSELVEFASWCWPLAQKKVNEAPERPF